MKDISIQEFKNDLIQVIIFTYTGFGDPVIFLNEFITSYVGNNSYNEFIDANMDNPWVRIIIKNI